jgi:pimeloyl-ACP methyl ester carboxylesterase
VDVERDADVLAEFLAGLDLGGKVHVVGMSAGGAIAAYLRLLVPDRVQTLALLSTPFVQWGTEAVKIYQREMARLVVTDGIDTVFRRFNEYIVGPSVDLHTRARYKAMLAKCRHETMVALLTGDALSARPDMPAKLDLPVLLPYGTHDVAMTPAVVEKMLAAFPNARSVAVENAALADFWRASEAP